MFLLKKRFEQSPKPIPLLTLELLAAFLGSLKSVAAFEDKQEDVKKITSFISSSMYHRISLLLGQLPERVRLVGDNIVALSNAMVVTSRPNTRLLCNVTQPSIIWSYDKYSCEWQKISVC